MILRKHQTRLSRMEQVVVVEQSSGPPRLQRDDRLKLGLKLWQEGMEVDRSYEIVGDAPAAFSKLSEFDQYAIKRLLWGLHQLRIVDFVETPAKLSAKRRSYPE